MLLTSDAIRFKLLTVCATSAVVLFVSGCSPGDSGNTPVNDPGVLNPTPQGNTSSLTIGGTPGTTAPAGTIYQFRPDVTNPTGGALLFSIANLPLWATFDTTDGTLRGTPQTANVGSYGGIVITVSNGTISASTQPFTIQVTAPLNRAPTITGVPITSVAVGSTYVFQPTGSDPDGDPISYAVQNLPNWATFNSSTGRLQGTPQLGNVGTYSRVTVSVSDTKSVTSLPAFDITVVASNTPPTISGTPAASVTTGSAYSFTPSATDINGDPLTFSIVNKPTWAAFNTSTGRLSGTPVTSNVGQYIGIEIRVSDGASTVALPAFSIAVVAANTAPTISGTPPSSVVVNNQYTFTPSASDADGDTLTFSIANMPTWASFNTATGRLQGTPGTADAGTYANITIRVTDGTATTSLASFAINVAQTANGTVTVTWTPPTQNTDGSTLTDLAGYWILYGTNTNNLNQQVKIASAGTTTYVVENLVPGTYYFAIKAYNAQGTESSRSNLASKIVQ